MAKKAKIDKTLVEKILDRKKVVYESLTFATQRKGDVADLDISSLTENERMVYKTLVASGNKTGPACRGRRQSSEGRYTRRPGRKTRRGSSGRHPGSAGSFRGP